MNYFKDKTILITGAAGGLGSEMARQLAAAGARLVLTDLKKSAAADLPLPLAFYETDLSTKQGCATLFETCEKDGLEIDMLINNAGLAFVGEFHEVPDEKWEKVIDVNLMAPIRLTRLFVRGMTARGRGHIVNISSVGGHLATPFSSSYAVSKFGIRGFGAAIAPELRPHGIFVSDVFPSFTRTGILQSERIGNFTSNPLPDFLIEEPQTIVRNILAGVARKERQIFPSLRARLVKGLADLVPELASDLGRLLFTLVGR